MKTKTAWKCWCLLFAFFWAFCVIVTENEPSWISPIVASVSAALFVLVLARLAEVDTLPPVVHVSHPRSEVTFVGGPLDGQRRQVWDKAKVFCVPELIVPPRDGTLYRVVDYDRNASNSRLFVYREPG